MKAIVITQSGGPQVLQLQDRPIPEPGHGQVRVRVSVAGLNRADLLQRAGHYPAPADAPADIPGMEIMGTVDATGPGVTAWKTGDRVFGLVGGGGYAEYVLTHERLLAPVPANLSDSEAGAVPEVFMTAHDALFSQAELKPGESVLIHTVGGGVGTAALQLVKAVGGTAYGTARSQDKLERAKELGLDAAVPLPDFAVAIKEATSGRGVDIVLDFVGKPYLAQNLQSLAPLGRLVQIGTLAGSRAEIDLALVMTKRLRIFGTVLRSRPLEQKIAVTQSFSQQVVPLLASGGARPIIDKVFALEEAVEAHRYFESNVSFGKVLLKISDG